MGLVEKLAATIVFIAGVWLMGLAAVAFAKPGSAEYFLGRFASSAFTHFLEVFLRIIVGIAFIIYSSRMKFSGVFTVFGSVLILTSVVLLFVPWKLHRRFADWSLPLATGRMLLFGFVSLIGGLFILLSFFLGA
ncbi:MAG TPA: hypothetical protein VJL58_04315 [Pyrinomonadaceae bacterium]|nr:hypothetical protein [Pyrinomonadaceae bacterium]